MKVAFVFPGQGAQEVGMGLALAREVPEARAVFDAVDGALDAGARPLSSLCFEGPVEELTLTANTQPAILAASVACLQALRARLPALRPSLLAGHSLGEYTALVASGALDLPTAVRLLRLRGTAMQEAVAPGVGSMAAILMLGDDLVAELCEQVSRELPGRVVQPANFNCPGQVVVAGHDDAVARVTHLAHERRGKAMMLKVSAPFHCALMDPAAERLARALDPVVVAPLAVPVVSNIDAAAHQDPSRVKDLLVRQVAGAVRWSDTVRAMVDEGVGVFVEVGPGRVLSGLIRRIHKGLTTLHVSDPASLDAAVAALESMGLGA